MVADSSRTREIAAEIRKRIEAGEWASGAKLPRLDDFAQQYSANRDTVNRAIGVLEVEGYVWAVQGSGITVRYGAMRPRRPRGDLVKRNGQATGYSFPSASGQELWIQHGPSEMAPATLDDARLAKLLGVPVGTEVLRRHRVTGPASEAPYQVVTSWIHPRVADLVIGVNIQAAAGEWLVRIEKGGHWPISWVEFHRSRQPTKDEASLLKIPTSLPVLEITRQGTSGGDNKPVEVTTQVIAGDRVETVHVLVRDPTAEQPWPEDEAEHEHGW
jgi:DNA-binding GntR family transcriptional regulator